MGSNERNKALRLAGSRIHSVEVDVAGCDAHEAVEVMRREYFKNWRGADLRLVKTANCNGDPVVEVRAKTFGMLNFLKKYFCVEHLDEWTAQQCTPPLSELVGM